MKKLVSILGIVSLAAIALVAATNLWLSSLTLNLVEPALELDEGLGQYAKVVESVELTALVDFPHDCNLELGSDITASIEEGTQLELDLSVGFQVDNGKVSLVPNSAGLMTNVPVTISYKDYPAVDVRKLEVHDSSEASKEKQISVEARTALNHLFMALVMGTAKGNGEVDVGQLPNIELPRFKAVLRKDHSVEFLQPMNMVLGVNPSEIVFSDVKVVSGKWATGSFAALLSLKDSLATDQFEMQYSNETLLSLKGQLTSELNSSTQVEIDSVELAFDDAKFQTRSGLEKATVPELKLNGVGSLAFAKNWEINGLNMNGSLQCDVSNLSLKDDRDTFAVEKFAVEDLNWNFDLKSKDGVSIASFSNSDELALKGMSWERNERGRGIEVFGVDLTVSPGKFSSDEAIEIDLPKAIATAESIAVSLDSNRKLLCRGIQGKVDGLASKIQLGADDNWLPDGTMTIDGAVKSIQLEEKDKVLIEAVDLIVKLSVGVFKKGSAIQAEINTSAKLNSSVNGIPMSLKKSEISVDTGPILIDINEKKKEVAVKQMKVRVKKQALVTAIQQSVPSSTKPEKASLGGRDLGRFVSLGTVKDFRVRWNAYGIKVPHVNFGDNSAEVVVNGKVKAVLEAKVITTRSKVVGKTKVPKIRMKMKKIGFVKTKVPEIYWEVEEIKVPEITHKWEDGPSATVTLGMKGKIDFVLPQKTQLSNAKIGGVVKLQSFDIKDFPGWIEKNLLNPVLSKVKPKKVEKKISDLLSPDESKQFGKIWIESSSISTEGDEVVLTVSGNVTLDK